MQSVQEITHHWAKVAPIINITRPSNELEYAQLLELIDHITDIVADPEDNPYSALLDLAFSYAHDWEERHTPVLPDATPAQMLEFLMQQRKLKQTDLEKAEIADQAVISNILSGKRGISVGVAKKLAVFFAVPVDLFL